MLRFLRKTSLKQQLIISFATIAVISISILGIIQIYQLKALIDESKNNQVFSTEQLNSSVDDFVGEHRRAIETLALQLGVLEDADYEKKLELLSTIKKKLPSFKNMYIGDTKGTAVVFYPEMNDQGQRNAGNNFSDRDYYKNVVENEKTVVSGVFEGRVGFDGPIITIVSPIFDKEGNFDGYVLGALDLKALENKIVAFDYGEGYPVVVDQSNRVVYHPNYNYRQQIRNLSDEEVLRNKGDSLRGSGYYFSDYKDQEEYISYETIPSLGWTVLVSKPASIVINAFKDSIFTILYFMVVTTLFMIGVGTLIATKFDKTVSVLLNYTQRVTVEGDSASKELQKLEGQRLPKEMVLLANHFHKMAMQINDSKKQLVYWNNQLEKRVKERTSSLEMKNDELRAISQLIGSISSKEDIAQFIQVSLEKIKPIISYPILFLNQDFSVSSQGVVQNENIHDYFSQQTKGDKLHIEPIFAEEERVGYLIVDLLEKDTISENDQQFLQTLASSFGVVLKNKLLFEKQRTKHAELNAVLTSMSEGVLLVKKNSKILYTNEFFKNLNRNNIPNFEGEHEDVFNDWIQQAFQYDEDELDAYLKEQCDQLKVTLETENQKLVYIIYRFNVLDDGELLGKGYLIRDITQQEEIDFLKDNLISMASHEFKTPITSIRGSVETLLRKDTDWDKAFQLELLEGVHEDIARIEELINDWLDISKIDSKSLYVNRIPTKISKVIEETILSFSDREAVSISYNPEALNKLPIVSVDKNRFKQVLLNIFTNAIRYNDEEQKQIQIETACIDGEVRIRISDNGIGIPVEHTKKVFDRFYRVDSSATTRTGGTGLGLAICKGIMAAHGGDIWVEPQVHGSGTTFILALPITGEKGEDQA
ncbi:Sensor histidine kinase YycG [Paraliobacillus sp. PM-2]|uniref:ATP-binding protein n=1 Tax=Paraliobacillus sp. PM-2 TaxID=1462524 RepID=UPI00061BF769|nr:ATP-binding protein [Paraliobacillus sp. PM-2]CQR46301.1 Sensor histidine kinase YycG [Paraliobacillus sp. PM-2]